jgi:hypothetical protein
MFQLSMSTLLDLINEEHPVAAIHVIVIRANRQMKTTRKKYQTRIRMGQPLKINQAMNKSAIAAIEPETNLPRQTLRSVSIIERASSEVSLVILFSVSSMNSNQGERRWNLVHSLPVHVECEDGIWDLHTRR